MRTLNLIAERSVVWAQRAAGLIAVALAAVAVWKVEVGLGPGTEI